MTFNFFPYFQVFIFHSHVISAIKLKEYWFFYISIQIRGCKGEGEGRGGKNKLCNICLHLPPRIGFPLPKISDLPPPPPPTSLHCTVYAPDLFVCSFSIFVIYIVYKGIFDICPIRQLLPFMDLPLLVSYRLMFFL